jgi:hypothetical protein
MNVLMAGRASRKDTDAIRINMEALSHVGLVAGGHAVGNHRAY